MRSKAVAELLSDLPITLSHSRPHVSDNNLFSEAQSNKLKYHPALPERFGCIEDARAHCQAFFTWYNTVHRYSGIRYMTPQSVHNGVVAGLRIARKASLDAAFAATPIRFQGRHLQLPDSPTAAGINPPLQKDPSTPNATQRHVVNL